MAPKHDVLFISGGKFRTKGLLSGQGNLFLFQPLPGISNVLFGLPHLAVQPGNLLFHFPDDLFQLRKLNLFEHHIGILLQCGDIVFAVPDFLPGAAKIRQNIHSILDVCINIRGKGILQFFQILQDVLLLPALISKFPAFFLCLL